ncbi:MAG: hypothetical protein FWG84_01200 [Bacteroidales bacterium]|nr:hypothetical protein [Bacteroidales bacterium]
MKPFKTILNILIFLLIIGFVSYMVYSMMSKEKTAQAGEEATETTFVSFYKKTNSFDVAAKIRCFAIDEDAVYVALSDKISVFDLSGKHQRDFEIEAGVRDIVVDRCKDGARPVSTKTTIYLLYPTRIDLYTSDGEKEEEWEACSENTDYCAFTTTADYVFVTDAENKHIAQYDKQGGFVRFIKSPDGFIIPSYSFGIVGVNDTIYCSNSGRYSIESYTVDGEFITSFGKSGTQAGAFAGCCNPVYLEKSPDGNILTSEKGIPRISCYGKDGKFRTVLFDSNMLGGGTAAYRMKVSGENIYIANNKTITVYCKDVACNVSSTEKSCAGCEKECPLRKGVKK